MKKKNLFIATALSAMLLAGMSACSSSSEEDAANQPEPEAVPASTDKGDSSVSDLNEKDQTEGTSAASSENHGTDNSEQDHPVKKAEGKQTYIEKLDNIQKELDAMPEKKDSDKGVTNAMKSYYGVSYEKYDHALNEIYALLKKELSPEVFADLETEQVKWIEEKEEKAEKERLKYEGGTFENVAWYISLYESTKDRCYELVNQFMTD